MRWVFVAAALALSACAVHPRDGQFTCASGACPDGFECVAEICVRPSDAGVGDSALPDTGRVDSGPVDSGPVDSGPVDSGNPDSSVDSGPPACDADFCADFDHVSRVDEGWSIPEVQGTGVVNIVDVADAWSPPSVFRSSVSVPPPDAGFHAARLSLQPTGPPAYEISTPILRLDFRIRVTEFIDSPGITIGAIAYGTETGPGSGPVNVVLSLSPNAEGTGVDLTYFFAPDSSAGVRVRAPIRMNTWTHVELVIARRDGAMGDALPPGITLWVDGTPQTLTMAPLAVLTPFLRFDLGLATTNPDGYPVTVEYDDVRIDYLPH